MRILVMFGAVLLALSSAQAFDAQRNPANPVEAAYMAAKPPMPRTALKKDETTQSRAEAWEAFAAKEAHEHSTVTGLKGQEKDSPNCRECAGWAWLNTGTAWYLHGESLRSAKATEKVWLSAEVRSDYMAALGKAVECYGKCVATTAVTDSAKGMAEKSAKEIETLLGKLEKSAK
jgi:hypothetical protein